MISVSSTRKSKLISASQSEQLLRLKRAEVALRRDVAKQDLWYFINEVLWPEDAPKHYQESLHKPICDSLSSADTHARKLFLLPRGHRKTYIVTVAHATWRIIRDPNVRIILVSALDDTAQRFTQIVKSQFQYNEALLSVFPEFRVPQNTQFGRTYDFTHPQRTNTNLIDPTFRAFYFGAPVAGRRCDILLLDDPIEKKHVTTPEQAEKSLHNFNDLIPIVEKTGIYDMIFISGTRWAFNDIYGAMLGESSSTSEASDKPVVSVFDSMVRHCLEDSKGRPDFEHGEPILDSVWTRELLLRELDQYRSDPKQGEEDWWKQYMNVCQSPSGKKFEEEWFDTWLDKLPGVIHSGIAVDSANKDEQVLMRGDFTVAYCYHLDPFGHCYLSDGIRSDRMRGADLIRELISMHQRCTDTWNTPPSNFIKEKVGEDTFFGWVRSEFSRARIPLTVIPLPIRGQGKKYVRIIEALQHPAQGRHIHFIKGFPESLHKAIVAEATHLGQWSHDDAVDALSLCFHPLVRVNPAINGGFEWKTPYNARIKQLSTPPAARHTGGLDYTHHDYRPPPATSAGEWSTRTTAAPKRQWNLKK